MEIVKYPNGILTTPCSEVEDFEAAENLANEMLRFMETLSWGKPVGLAANQVGSNLRMFIALGDIYINPTLTPNVVWGKKKFFEGCYSLEDQRFDYKTERYKSIHLRWQDRKQNWHEEKFTGFPAQVIQHEYDHIIGKLCTDY